MHRSPSERSKATTLRKAFATALARRLVSTTQQDAMSLVPAYRVLISLSTAADPATTVASADETTAQSRTVATSTPEDGTATTTQGTEASTGVNAPVSTAVSAATPAETLSTACYVAEVMITALQEASDLTVSHTEDCKVGHATSFLCHALSHTITISLMSKLASWLKYSAL